MCVKHSIDQRNKISHSHKAREEGNCRVDNAVWVDAGDCGSGKALGQLQWCLIGK